tara:strand:+ start:433 stop:1794 length:1362 start_codon:yes stop_codon:yes gene_type:complete
MNKPMMLLTAPFRTHLNLNSARASALPDNFKQDLAVICEQAANALPRGVSLRPGAAATPRTNIKYSSLAEDSLPACARPFLTLDFTNARRPGRTAENLTVESCTVELYDNTIGVLQLLIEMQPDGEESLFRGIDPTDFDKEMSLLCTSQLSEIYPSIGKLGWIVGHFAANNPTSSFLPQEKFTIFANEDGDISGVQELTPRWVSRALIVPGKKPSSSDISFIRSWTHQPALCGRTHPSEDSCVEFDEATGQFFVGNSIVCGQLKPLELSALASSFSLSNYFYTIADIVNSRLTEMISTSRMSTQGERMSMAKQHLATCSHLDYMECLFNDMWLGLQGHRKKVAVALFSAWEYGLLKKSIGSKRLILDREIAEAIESRRMRNERLVEVFLASIGGVALLDFCINLYAYVQSGTSTPRGFPGLSGIPAIIPIDVSLYSLILAIAVLAIAIVRKGR